MRVVLPGKPQARLQAISTALWDGQRLIAYVSGNALIILGGPHDLIQTLYHDGCPTFDALAIDERTGKIAVCNHEDIYVYQPYGRKEGAIKWSLQNCWHMPVEEREIFTLSWGIAEELLVGSWFLKIFQTVVDEAVIWSTKLSTPAKLANFSPDASMIASTGCFDRLIKLWRRQSYGTEDTKFDFTYLPHPRTVTSLQWRKSRSQEQDANVLYSICADNKIRIWAVADPHGFQVLQLRTEIDMQESIQVRGIYRTSQTKDRYAFIIDSLEFAHMAQKLEQTVLVGGQDENHTREHLVEIAKRNPEVCIVLDGQGNMSAWGIEKVSCKAREMPNKFNIAHVENFKLPFPIEVNAHEQNLQILSFCAQGFSNDLILLVHFFDGRIAWLEGTFYKLFDLSPQLHRMKLKALWTGHDSSIKKIVRNRSGTSLFSRTNNNEGVLWKQETNGNTACLTRSSILSSKEHLHRTCILNQDFVVHLHPNSISLWNTRSSPATQLTLSDFCLEGKLLCLLLLCEPTQGSKSIHVAAITSHLNGIVWEIRLDPQDPSTPNKEGSTDHFLKEFCTFNLGSLEALDFMLPVDPAGSPSTTSSFLDTFAKDVAISYTSGGLVCAWTAVINIDESSVNWLVTSKVETGIQNPSLASGSSTRKTAIVDAPKTGLTIWDVPSGQLEHEVCFQAQDMIQDLDWSSTPDDQSILAIGFPHKVLILSQMRFDYLSTGPAWASIRQIHTKESTPHPIGDSVWLGSGNLVVGSGHQLYIYDTNIGNTDELIADFNVTYRTRGSTTIFDLVTYLNGPLPLFHPQFLAQCILAGKLLQVQRIILNLYKLLQGITDGEELDSFLSLPGEFLFTEQQQSAGSARKEKKSSYADFTVIEEPESVSEVLATSLNERLAKLTIPHLSSHEQILLADTIECVATAEKHRRAMDDNAMRFLLFFRWHSLRKGQAPIDRIDISWREIIWAYHSDNQEILRDLVGRQFRGRMLWKHAKECGIFMWMTDLTALKAQFETVARNEYTKSEERNPVDCSLYYLALKKKNVLLGLWRMATWNREQSSTQKLLSHDFQEPRWRTAALKNAYALLGKRRFEYAAAFFLLAGNLQNAVNICAHQLQDIQLAISIARVYEGDDGFVLRSLLEDKILPQAALEGNRWLASWCFWMLGRRDKAVRVLISPVYTLLDSPETPSMQAKSFLANDPALVILYRQLREKTLQTLKGASMISPRAEWEFVIQNARLYDRMGCDLLALDLVRNWEFLVQPKERQRENNSIPDPRKMLRRRSSLVVDDLPSPGFQNQAKGGKALPQKVFEEPDANSLLDSFGF